MREVDFFSQFYTIAFANAPARGCPFADAVECDNRGLFKGRWEKRACRMGFMMIGKIDWAGIAKGIVNTVINIINGLIQGVVSGLPGGGAIASQFKIPTLQEGGIVPGPIDKPRLILAHGGEEVIPRGERPNREIVVHQTNIINKDTDMIAAMRELGWRLST